MRTLLLLLAGFSPVVPVSAWAQGADAEVWAWVERVSTESPSQVRIGVEQSARFPRGGAAPKAARFDSNMVTSAGSLAELKAWGPKGTALVSRTEPLPAGLHLFQFALKPEDLTIPAPAFARHLEERGLGAVLRERARRKEDGDAGRERRVRVGKALIDLGEAAGAPQVLSDAPVRGAGFAYDIVPTSPPQLWRTGQRVEVKALRADAPVLDRAVFLTCADRGRARTVQARTDAYGLARLEVPAGERCLLQSIDMVRVEGDWQWESVWVTFTFARRK